MKREELLEVLNLAIDVCLNHYQVQDEYYHAAQNCQAILTWTDAEDHFDEVATLLRQGMKDIDDHVLWKKLHIALNALQLYELTQES